MFLVDPFFQVWLAAGIDLNPQGLIKTVLRAKAIESKTQMVLLKTFLGIADDVEDSFDRAQGSCEWIDDRDDFQEWRDPAEGAVPALDEPSVPTNDVLLSIYWVLANPGTGKTFLASHVADELAHFQLQRASYFFHVGDKTSNLAHLLRSVACQMANSNAAVRQRLLELHDEGVTFDRDDASAIWAKIFKKGIFLVSKDMHRFLRFH